MAFHGTEFPIAPTILDSPVLGRILHPLSQNVHHCPAGRSPSFPRCPCTALSPPKDDRHTRPRKGARSPHLNKTSAFERTQGLSIPDQSVPAMAGATSGQKYHSAATKKNIHAPHLTLSLRLPFLYGN